ncbi:MAG: hypothetical protein QF600_11505 [Verrucomicrobiota bacterium]|nr:hypothetical protein [Verrucomicrobiota bacterium]
MKALVLLLVAALGQFVLAVDKKPSTKEVLDIRDEQPIPSGPEYAKVIEAAIRVELKKLTGKLTEADLEKVTSLNLNNTIMLDEGLKELPKLRYLRLFGTLISDAGLKELTKRQQLTAIDLGLTQISDAGLKELPKLKKLRSLNLNDTKVTKAGVAELKKALPNCEIGSNPKKQLPCLPHH